MSAEEALPSAVPGFNSTSRRFGDYVLGRQVGAGGMGVVYEARCLSDNRRVALKLIRDSHVASPSSLCRFTIEAEAAARLEHLHIVRIHEVGESEGQPFFSMDFIEGESLSTGIARGEFDLTHGDASSRQKQIARLMAKVAHAVHHAHVRGVLHRDIKPGNILLDAAGEPHLTDFGLAKILQRNSDETEPFVLTTSGDAPGTPSYMAPEQVSGVDAGSATDIYGLGAVMYALLTGRPPFRGATALELFKQIVEQLPARPRSLQPAVDADLETICLKCLEKDSRRRYGSAEALAEDLERYTAGRPIRARPVSLVYRSRQWIKRNPVGTALIATLLLGLCVALTLLKIVNDQRREIEADRDQTFDEGMQKVSQIWRDPATRFVTISARELAILAERSPADLRGARHQLTLGVSANDGPSSMAQRYARLLGNFQEQMTRELGEKVVFQLRLLKQFNPNDETLSRGEIDFLVMSAIDFLQAETRNPDVTLVARASHSREGVIFAHTNSAVGQLIDLRGKSVAFPDPSLSLAIRAKARLSAAGLRRQDLGVCTNIADQGADTGQTVVSTSETVDRVLRRQVDAGVTHRAQFERYRHAGLVALDRFPETPDVLAVRAGLEPRLTEALRNVLRSPSGSKAWPESKFVSEVSREEGSAAGTSLGDLRQAVQQAAGFEGR